MDREEQDDLRHAAFYLSLDKDEMQNVIAEHRKADARRKTAKEYGDSCSGPILPPIEPVSFASCHCIGCELVLTTQNHAGNLICHRCKAESDALIADARAARDRHQSKLAKGVAGMWTVFAWIVVAMCAAATLGWAVGAISWQLGIRW